VKSWEHYAGFGTNYEAGTWNNSAPTFSGKRPLAAIFNDLVITADGGFVWNFRIETIYLLGDNYYRSNRQQ